MVVTLYPSILSPLDTSKVIPETGSLRVRPSPPYSVDDSRTVPVFTLTSPLTLSLLVLDRVKSFVSYDGGRPGHDTPEVRIRV